MPTNGIVNINDHIIKNGETKILLALCKKSQILQNVSSDDSEYPDSFKNQALLLNRCI